MKARGALLATLAAAGVALFAAASLTLAHAGVEASRVVDRKRGALTERARRGAQVGGLGMIVDCTTPARLVVRIRGAFTRPTALRPYRIFDLTMLRAEAPARVTTIALSTMKGRPIATAKVEDGTAFLFTSGSCEED
jgi:hypothetical protein